MKFIEYFIEFHSRSPNGLLLRVIYIFTVNWLFIYK